MIGIGITTHNRNNLVRETYRKIRSLTPDAKIVVVDDFSDIPVEIDGVEIYRSKENIGIARAKNKCLELLQGCDHIFLFDDDTYPLKAGWERPYIESPEHHLMYSFENWYTGRPVGDDKILYRDNDIVAHKAARGCMMYVDSVVLNTVGGMDTRYGKAMHEHVDWTNRIHNAGLTTFRVMDVVDSNELIYSMDEHQEVASSINGSERAVGLQLNDDLIRQSETSTHYVPYGKDIVLTCYFTGSPDPQRNVRWKPDHEAYRKLKESVESHGVEFVLLHDCFSGLENRVSTSLSPYFERWLQQWRYLRDRPDINNVFVVDATDVDMVNNPFPHIKEGKLYVGDEPGQTLSNEWMVTRHLEPSVNNFLRSNAGLPLLNAGVAGGSRKMIMDLCRAMYEYHLESPQDQTDMGIFNYLTYNRFHDVTEYGRHVTSLFKKYEKSTNAWFRHK